MNFYRSFIHNSPNWKQPTLSTFTRWMVRQTIVYLYQRMYSWTFIPEKLRLCSHRNLYISCNFICNSQKLELVQRSFNRRMITLTVLQAMDCNASIRETNYWNTQLFGGISQKLCWVKKAYLRRLRTILFHVQNICAMTKFWKWRSD